MRALIDEQAIIVISDGETVLVSASDPTFAAVRRYLLEEHGQDIAAVREMITNIRGSVKALAEEAVSVVDGAGEDTASPAYRVVHGDPVEDVVLAAAVRLTREDTDLAPLGAFLKRLERNPSPASRSQLFGWLKAGGFTLTPDGFIVGFKSVRDDGFSQFSGAEPVTVEHQDGTAVTLTGRVPYPVGATVWMPRELVDDDRNSACSVGLHVGTLDYAEYFSRRVLVILVDPADVVSVPAHESSRKMRVCRLKVARLYDGQQITGTVIDAIRTVPDLGASEEYDSRPENDPRRAAFAAADLSRDDDDDDEDDDDEDFDKITPRRW